MTAINVALVSGGRDSTVAADVATTNHEIDFLAYLDTGTGLTANREYVETLADHLDLQLWTLRTSESYAEIVREHGFPGPGQHTNLYHKLKERQLQKLATVANGYGNPSDLHLWTGVRSDESTRRMNMVEPTRDSGQRWIWHAPIHDWSAADCAKHVAMHDLPRNELWNTLGRSGDCYCGAFGTPEELLDLRAAGFEDHAEAIESLQREVSGTVEHDVWAWQALSEKELRAKRADHDDDQFTLCSSCGLPEGSE